MINVGIIGATGYTGIGLINLLLGHPRVELSWLTSTSYAGKKISEVYPHLEGITDLVCQSPNLDKIPKAIELVFVCLPHGLAMDVVPSLLKKGIKVIDLGADYRLKDPLIYKKWYGLKHKNPKLLKTAVYGLPELFAKDIETAQLVANPGCYATASILGLAPLLKKKIYKKGSIIIDAKSGVSGAGKEPSAATHFTTVDENFCAYKVAQHRHNPEIEQILGTELTFVPHLLPMVRGILATIYVKGLNSFEGLEKIYKDFYKGSPFVRIKKDLPSTKYVANSNFCDIKLNYDAHTGQVIILSAIDNLVKGAAGQAIQNMNLMFGFSEKQGLEQVGVYP